MNKSIAKNPSWGTGMDFFVCFNLAICKTKKDFDISISHVYSLRGHFHGRVPKAKKLW